MYREPRPGTSPLDRLGSHFDEDLVCPDCGYDDSDGHWMSDTSGDRVRYRHVCPSCGSVRRRTITLGDQ